MRWPWRQVGVGLAASVLILLVLSSLLFEAAYAERVHPNVRALGVDLGGKTTAEAQAALASRMSQFVREPVVLYYADREWRTTPEELGWRLEVMPLAQAAYATGRDVNPVERLVQPARTLFAGREIPQPAGVVDAGRARRLMQEIAGGIERPVANAALVLEAEADARFTPAQTGRKLNVDSSLARLQTALLVGDNLRVPLAVEETAPRISDGDLQAARDQLDMFLGAPVSLQLGSDAWALGPKDLAAAVELVGGAERPRGARVNRGALERAVRPLAHGINQWASNARFEFVGGDVRVIRESRDGREVDFAGLVAAVEQAMNRADDRVVPVPAKITRPAVTSDQRQQLGIRELIVRGETRFAGSSPPKIHNIKLAASRLHGVVVPPGATFSFNNELGPTTLDSGYQLGWGIAATGFGGHTTIPSVAGGICQVATTLFQPVFWGGYQIEERHHHLYWIPAYGLAPLGRVGLDATVDEDYELDLRFVNSSPDYLLIQAVTDDTTLYVSLYGNKPSWTVSVDGPTITNRRAPNYDVVRNPESTLPWGQSLQVESAHEGFEVSLVRTVRDSNGPRTYNLATKYEPSQNLVVVGTRGAPPGVAEEIRASNVRSAPPTAAAPASAPSAAPSVGVTSAPAFGGATAPAQGAPAPRAPVAAPAEPVRQAPATAPVAVEPPPASRPQAPAPVAAPPAAAPPPAPAPAPAAPVYSAPAAPAPAAPAAPAVPRFSGS